MPDQSSITRRAVVRALPMFGAAAAVPLNISASAEAGVLDHPDAALLQLSEELDRAWDAEQAVFAVWRNVCSNEADENTDAAAAVSSGIVEQIGETPATTLDGLRVKAKAVLWCHCGELESLDGDDATTDIRLADSILRDLTT